MHEPTDHPGVRGLPPARGLYDPSHEHDACGFGFVAHIKGRADNAIVDQGLTMLERMEHRGACGCEPDSGDGAGILVATPDAFFRRVCRPLGIDLPPLGEYAVAMLFLPKSHDSRRACEALFEKVVNQYDMTVLGWRDVPTDDRHLGPTPKKVEPRIRQAFVAPGERFYNRADFNRRLYLVRQQIENTIEHGDFSRRTKDVFYVNLISTNRMVYKGMLTANQLRGYYPDLSDPAFASPFAVVHSRFSTNTFPSWRLAHPYRYLAHNGEINTLRGNRNWMKARYGSLESEVFGDELDKLFPILSDSTSDSATLDNCAQFLTVNGRSLPHTMLMLVPEAWQNNPQMDPDLRAFYEYHAMLMEPWDGPAGIAFTDGRYLGAILDRNGLRPARYYLTKDDLIIMASEAGVLPVDPTNIARKWRLQPGKMLLIDFKEGRIIDDAEVKADLVDKRPWKRWIEDNMVELESLPGARMKDEGGGMKEENESSSSFSLHPSALLEHQHAFGYTNEDLRLLMYPMAAAGAEAVGSMGADTPLACLSDRPQLLYNYFKQLFAQVTNPPLDAIREEMVTSLLTYLGDEGNLLAEVPEHARKIKLKSPVLTTPQLESIRQFDDPDFKSATLPMLYDVAGGEAGLKAALDALCAAADAAVADGCSILILSDRGVGKDVAPIPALLATGAVHHHLIRQGNRTRAGLIVETAEAREAHHFCCLLGYGVGAINPYLALESIADIHAEGLFPEELTVEMATKNFVKAANKGILKVASKMGISTVQSYRGAQIFEAVGVSKKVIDAYFSNTASRLGGIGLDVIAAEAAERHRRAYPRQPVEPGVLDAGGFYQWRRDGEFHGWNPDTVAKLQHAVRIESYATFKQYTAKVNDESRRRATLRGLLEIKESAAPVPLEEVEPSKEIVKRFCTGAMSFGSISKESHETLAVAMNRIGGKSNSGEGGEDRARFLPDERGDWRRSAIKQVASGRFGVTTEYLVNSQQLQIKVAQGAKPGEGGQLPGHKVDEYIASVRHSTPGVGLVSPPPHHDIYSIEDLAQLIHDLKNVRPAGEVSVKLVSEVGVGTVAAGVAKAKADHILISGDGGGTGSSPLTSIKHAGIPWEMGLSETQQVLLMNGLRGRVTLQADGSMKTGRDVVVAALLGAEEIGFSTAPLIANGCVMMRVCHLNTCPVGIATQDPELRKKFRGTPEQIVNFMFFIADEVREFMAAMGFRTFDDMVGRTDLLSFADLSGHPKAATLDLSAILYQPEVRPGDSTRRTMPQNHGLEDALDRHLIERAAPALERGEKVSAAMSIQNTNRTVGTTLSGVIAQKHGFAGLPDGTIHFKFKGSAGQSFGAFLARGVTLELEGDANDYTGKGLSGGRIMVYPPAASLKSGFKAEENIIAGNVIGYGAIAGELYLRGIVGERFLVRNSGATAVVEGCGDHGCEYMTGGRAVILGPTGRNFAAGMSGGIAYVYDALGQFPKLCNPEMVELEPADTEDDLEFLRRELTRHAELTGSARAKEILAEFEREVRYFVKVMPSDYRRVLGHKKEIAARAEALAEKA